MLDNIPRGALWLPGVGETSVDEREASTAVQEYDSDLVLGQRRDSGEWIVFLQRGGDAQPLPVLGLGTRLPHPQDILKKLHDSDARRRGDKIVSEIVKRQDAAKKELVYESHERDGVLAEHLEHGFRKEGKHPSPRVFIPSGVKSVEAS